MGFQDRLVREGGEKRLTIDCNLTEYMGLIKKITAQNEIKKKQFDKPQ